MHPKTTRSRKLRLDPHPGWFLFWVPLFLIALDDSPDLTSAMIRLGAVLVLGTVAWGMGRGPAGPWAERLFAALLLVAWFAACGTFFREQGVPSSVGARLAVTAGLLFGPALLLWAWRRRCQMMRVVDEAGALVARGSVLTVLRLGALVVAAVFILDRLLGLQRADLLVIGAGLALFATFRVRGRRGVLGVPG